MRPPSKFRFLLLIAFLTRAIPSNADWTKGVAKDEMTEQQSFVLAMESQNQWKGVLVAQSAILYLRCGHGTTELFLDAQQVVKSDLIRNTVVTRVRVDDKPPVSQVWTIGANHRAMFSRSPKEMIQQVAGAKRLRVEVPWAFPTDAPTWVADFNVEGLPDQLDYIAGPCKWKPKVSSPKTLSKELTPAPQPSPTHSDANQSRGATNETTSSAAAGRDPRCAYSADGVKVFCK